MPRWIAMLAALAIACAPGATPAPTLVPSTTSTPESNPPTPEPTAGPSPSPGPWLTMQWQQVEVRSAAGPVSLAGLGIASVAGGPRGGIALVLSEDDASTGASALVRLGEDWTLVPLVGWPAVNAWPTLAARPSGYLALMTTTPFESGAMIVRAWTSPDGIIWREAGELDRMENVTEVAATDDRIVVCGAAAGHLPACDVSSDGAATWRPSVLPPAIREIGGVIAFGDGFLATAADTAGRLRTLLTTDGLTWTMADADPAVSTGGWVTSLAQHAGVAILAGRVAPDRHTGAGGAALFTSHDGRSWQPVALPATEAVAFSLVDLGATALAVGKLSTGHAIEDVALLTSSDGIRWRLEPEAAWADADETSYGTASAMALVRASIWSGATQEVRLYAGTAVTTADPGVAPGPLPTPAPDPAGAPTPPAFTSVGSVPGSVRSATMGVDGFVAIGSGSDDSSPAVWTSDDGRRWIGGPAVSSADGDRVDIVAAWSGGYVAGGAGCPGACDEWSAEARFWSRSASGVWQQAPRRSDHSLGNRDLDGPGLGVRAIVETTGGLIAVAVSGSGGVVFRSTDGITWRRVAVLELAPFAAVAWHGGVIAAGGSTFPGDSRVDGAIWYSPDGIAWPAATKLESAAIAGLAASGDRVVAVANGPAAFASTDGRSWASAPDQSALTWGKMAAVLGGRDGFLALGYDPCPAGSACLTAWRSGDGLAWSRSVIEWDGPDDVTDPVFGYVLVGGRGEALALVPWVHPREPGDTGTVIWGTETAILGVPWVP